MNGGLSVVKLEVAPWFFAIFGHAPGEMIFGRFLVCPTAARVEQSAAAKTHYLIVLLGSMQPLVTSHVRKIQHYVLRFTYYMTSLLRRLVRCRARWLEPEAICSCAGNLDRYYRLRIHNNGLWIRYNRLGILAKNKFEIFRNVEIFFSYLKFIFDENPTLLYTYYM